MLRPAPSHSTPTSPPAAAAPEVKPSPPPAAAATVVEERHLPPLIELAGQMLRTLNLPEPFLGRALAAQRAALVVCAACEAAARLFEHPKLAHAARASRMLRGGIQV